MRSARNRTVRATLAVAGGALGLLLAGCMSVNLEAAGVNAPVSLTSEVNRDYRVVEHFSERTSAWFISQMITLSHPKVARIVEQQLRRHNGDAVVNLRISGRNTFGDSLAPLGAGLLAGGIYYFAVDNAGLSEAALIGTGVSFLLSRRSFFVEGDVVRYR